MTRAMKDSGVAWIGEIPQGWEITRFKTILREISTKGNPSLPLLAATQHAGVILKSEVGWRTMEAKADGRENFKLVCENDFVISLRSFEGGIEKSCVKGIISPAYTVLRLSVSCQCTPEYFKHYLKSAFFLNLLKQHQKGIRDGQAIPFGALSQDFVSLPPLSEQRAIAAYLDRQTAQIDQRLATLAEKKAVLAELRKAIIHLAVTKGSTWNAETGLVEGLPNGWEASHAKRLLRFITSGSRGWAEYYADEGDIFLRIGNLTRETIELDLNDVQYVRLPANATEGSRTRVREGDMLVSITADLGSIAVAPKLNKPAYVNQHIALCRSKKLVNPRWLGYAMVSLQSKQQMLNSGYGGTKIQLSLDDVRHVWLAVPPPDEQRAIADHLDQQTQQFDAQLATLDEQVRVLKELRKAIIHEAVTGKIDLAHYTPPPQQALAA